MKTVELFAGIGGFRIAADRCGYETVWANDLCSQAGKVYTDRFGAGEFQEGDVSKLLETIPKHELLTAGFPCQPFSSAGKKKGVEDPRGTLFSHIVDTLKRHQPKFFILENVKRLLSMDKGIHFATILASLSELNYRIEWRLLNALDFGLAQNRQRVLITGVRDKRPARHPFVSKDHLKIRLATKADVTTSRNFDRNRLERIDSWHSICDHGLKFPNWGLAWSGRYYGANLLDFSEGKPQVLLRSVLQPPSEIDDQFDFTASTQERLVNSVDVNRFVSGVEILSNQGGGARMGYTVFGINGIAPTLTATPSRHYERYKVKNRYRRLTNVEYARLQGFPDDHCSVSSVYSQYALYGNAVPPPMVEWVMRQLENSGIPLDDLPLSDFQRELFANA